MIVTTENYPNLLNAFKEIEMDNGGHLIGTVYPGEKIDLEHFKVPEAWAHLIEGAERGLARLAADSHDDLETFLCGDQTEADEIRERRGDLSEAHILIESWFNGWQPEDRPFAITTP